MAVAEGPLSTVVPVLVAALICDVAAVEPASGKKNLIGIFDLLYAAEFPTQRPLTLYWKLTDAEGRYKVHVRFVRVKGNLLLAEVEAEMKIANRLSSNDFTIPFPPLVFPEPGRYEFQILMNDAMVGSAFLDATSQQVKAEPDNG